MAPGLKGSPRHPGNKHRGNNGSGRTVRRGASPVRFRTSLTAQTASATLTERNLQGYDPCSLTGHTAFVPGAPTAMPSNPFVPSLRRAVSGFAAARLVVLAVAGCVLLGYGATALVFESETHAASPSGPVLKCESPDRSPPKRPLILQAATGRQGETIVRRAIDYRVTRTAPAVMRPPVRAPPGSAVPVPPAGAVDRRFHERSPAAGSGAAISVSRARGPERVRRES